MDLTDAKTFQNLLMPASLMTCGNGNIIDFDFELDYFKKFHNFVLI